MRTGIESFLLPGRISVSILRACRGSRSQLNDHYQRWYNTSTWSTVASSKMPRLLPFQLASLPSRLRPVWPAVRTFGRGLLNLALPPRCLRCDDGLPPQTEICLCLKCTQAIAPELGTCCNRCGAVLPEGVLPTESCPACKDFSLKFDAVYPLGRYQGALREMVLKTKRLSAEALSLTVGRLLAQRLAEKLAKFRADAVLPVPMHWAQTTAPRRQQPGTPGRLPGKKIGGAGGAQLGPLPLYWSSERPVAARAIPQCPRGLPPPPLGPATMAGLPFIAGG